jgi:type II secretory pathway component GspD/PulD (secretin)
MDSTNRLAAARIAALERIIRDRIEATRPKPQIEVLREQARQGPPPLLGLRERLKGLNFNNSSVRDILSIIGSSAGIRVTYDQAYQDKAYSIELEDVTVEEALQQIMSANQLFYKVVNPKTIIVINDRADKRQQYDEMVVRVFYVSHADAQELSQMVTTIMRVPQMPVAPVIMANKTANTITVRATAQVADIIERIIRSNDKPRAEVVVDVQILEVNRQRVKQYGLELNAYALGFMFSPEVAPPNTSAPPTAPPPSPPPFNLNTISQGVSTADFYMMVPTALVKFLETDARTKTIAKPQLRGAEGTKLTLNLGDDVPVLQTVFGAAAQGGFATIPQSSYTYRAVGVNVEMTPRVTYEGEIILELVVENSTVSGSINVGGQAAPTFGTRKVTTKLRMREGESNLLAGLLREEDRRSLSGFPGLLRLPVFKQFLSNNDQQITQTDIVMLLTPHIVRTHELTTDDLSPIYIGTQQNLGLGGPPPLIAPSPDDAPAPSVGTGATQVIPSSPGVAPGGVPRPPVASDPGAQPVNRPPAPGTSPVPTPIAPVPEKPGAALPPPPPPAIPPTGVIPPGIPPVTTGTPAGAAPPATQPRDTLVTPATPPGAPQATPAQIILTVPGTTFQVAGGPYTVPVSINNASRVSVMTLTITFNPNVLRVRNVQDGTFMRQGGVATTFTPQIDAVAGRVDIAITRTGDQTGASGAGLLAALLFDAVGPGSAIVTANGVASTPEGGPVTLQFSPVTVTVR